MLSRLFSRSFNLRYLTLISSNTPIHSPLPPPPPPSCRPFFLNPNSIFTKTSRCFSSNRNNNGDDPPVSSSWSISQNEVDVDSIFGEAGGGDLTGIVDGNDGIDNRVKNNASDDSWSGKGGGDSWSSKGGGDVLSEIDKEFVSDSWSSKGGGDVLSEIDKEFVSEKGAAPSGGGGGGWVDEWDKEAGGDKGWSFGEEDKSDVFDMGEIMGEGGKLTGLVDEEAERKKAEENALLEREKEALSAQLKGTNRAFGDLITASGITNEMLDSLILMKDLEGIEGLPPLHVLEDRRLQKNENKTTNAEIERKKQEEIAKSRVRQVDEKGRAYGTGRRKCSIARVWIEPGQGQFVVNDKPFDTYFPVLDHRADLLRPFSETKTLGLWDVKCTVKGGGVSGQVGAIRLGVSRALQNWEPGLRPPLRAAGFLTRDSRVVERKKPGKAKARKSFQWVKR